LEQAVLGSGPYHEEKVENQRNIVAAIASQEEQACLQRILKLPDWNVEVVQSLGTQLRAAKALTENVTGQV
jgi:hypothetical protein